MIAIFIALIIYAGGIFIGIGIFSLLDDGLVFASTGFVQIYLYLGIGLLASLLTVFFLSLSFRNISLLKIFPSLVGPVSYIALFFYFRIFTLATIFPMVIMGLYCLYIFLRGTITLKEVSSLDTKVSLLREKHPNSYILIYLFLGILIPSVLAFFSFAPSLYYLQSSYMLLFEGKEAFPLSYCDILAWIMMGAGLIFSAVVDAPLFIHKLKRGDDSLYQGGLWGKMKHPDIIGEIAFYLGASFSILHFENMYAFVLFPVALFLYIFLLIHPYCFKADSAYIASYGEEWKRK